MVENRPFATFIAPANVIVGSVRLARKTLHRPPAFAKVGEDARRQPATTTAPPAIKSRVGAILRATSGNFLEQFDFFLFGFYATYISKTFFPTDSEFASLMLTFAVFGAGFLMRPLGAIILGAYIDEVGRRKGRRCWC